MAACGGSCDGKGACAFAPGGSACAAASCSAGQLTQHGCDGLGDCTSTTSGCGGYACDAAGTACRTVCNSVSDCTGTFQCVGGSCVNDLPDGVTCGSNDAACKSKHCVDGVCCDTTCTGSCMACNVAGKLGSCSSLAGQLSATDCPGDASCGPGTCAAAGSCSYPKANTSCGASSCAGGKRTDHLCSATHLCTAKVTACAPYTCDAASKACRTGCTTHPHCVTGGLCDRQLAHKVGGAGACVAPAQVVTVGSGEEIADALKKVSAAKPYWRSRPRQRPAPTPRRWR